MGVLMLYIFGQIIDFFDKAYLVILQNGVGQFLAYVDAPLSGLLTLWVAFRGWAVWSGSLGVEAEMVKRELLGLVLILGLTTNAALYNQYVVGFLFEGLPDGLAAMAIQIAGTEGAQVAPTTFGGELTVLWAEVWKVEGLAYQSLGINFRSAFEVLLMGLMIGAAAIGLAVSAVIHVIAKFFLLIVVLIGGAFVALAMFRYTRPFFDRWIGKVVSLVLLQFMAILVTAVTLAACGFFLSSVAGGENPDPMANLEAMAAVVVIFFCAGMTIYYSPQFAYSLGSGNSVSAMPSAPRGLGSSSGGGGRGGGGGLGLSPDLKIGMNPGAMQSGGPSRPAALPPPPPRALGSP